MGQGMQWLCVYTILYSFVCMVALVTQDPRILNGGYNQQSCYWSATFGVLGALFGITGLAGVRDHNVEWVKGYNYFQYSKLVMMGLVFCMDWSVLVNNSAALGAAIGAGVGTVLGGIAGAPLVLVIIVCINIVTMPVIMPFIITQGMLGLIVINLMVYNLGYAVDKLPLMIVGAAVGGLFATITGMGAANDTCEKWMLTVESQINFNPALENVSSKNLCHYTRMAYLTGFIIDFGLSAYFTYVGYIYCSRLSQLPPHMIWFPGKNASFEGYNDDIGEPGGLLKDAKNVDPENQRNHIVKKSMYGAV